MRLVPFNALKHYDQVARLWERALGLTYAVTDRVLRQRIVTRASLDDGDGVVALEGQRVVGFGCLELDRSSLRPGDRFASILCVIVDPRVRRCGIGTRILRRMENRLKSEGCRQVTVSTSLYRFWTGIPDDLPVARHFFENRGYTRNYEAIDMFGALPRSPMTRADRQRLDKLGVTITSATDADIGRVCDLLTREAPKWRESLLKVAASGDVANVLLVKRGRAVIGCIQTFTPASRFRAANVVWERLYGADMGGLGAVLIAKKWRGKGMGVALCRAGAAHIHACGATGCFVDWTADRLASFYGKIGARLCRRSGMYSKSL